MPVVNNSKIIALWSGGASSITRSNKFFISLLNKNWKKLATAEIFLLIVLGANGRPLVDVEHFKNFLYLTI